METISTTSLDGSSGANPSSIKSDDSSPRQEGGRGSPPPNCAICLGTCRNKSFTDSCLHQFCFKCLLTWSKVKAECPLCKQNFRSIIHNVRSNHQYEEYMVEQRHTEETTDRIDIDNLSTATRRFRYRTTLTLPRSESLAIQQWLLHYPLMADVFPPPATRAPPARRHRSPAAFRRTVYRHNLWARPLPDFTGRFRDCTPDFYRYNDTQMHRLVPWINRELHYLLNENIGHISYVLTRILELLPQYHISSPEFRDAMQRYFGDRTEHFLHELYCFASTPYDMTGYDRNVQYTTDTRISTMVNEVISSSDSEASVDSDIVMVSSSEPAEPPPGPSRLPEPVYPQNYIPPPPPANVIPIETISQSDTDDDSSEVMVVGYIKPPQDRTPEVVDLLGSDSDVIVQENAPPEPTQNGEAQEPRPSGSLPRVKLILKRHTTRGSDSDDSDDSTYRQSPMRRARRRASPASATAGDTSRSTPSTSSASDWTFDSSQVMETRRPTSPEYATSDIGSDTVSDSSSFSSSDRRRKRLTKRKCKRKTRKETVIKKAVKKTKKRNTSRSRRRDRTPPVEPEKDRRSKRKSHSGKGVKSSKRSSDWTVVRPDSATALPNTTPAQQNATPAQPDATPPRPDSTAARPEPPAPSAAGLDQPSTSGVSSKRRSSRERKRRRSSRGSSGSNKRLKSVVNVMNSYKNSGDSSSSVNSNSVNKTWSCSLQYPNSSKEDDRTRRANEVPRENIEGSSINEELPAAGRSHSDSDPEDNIPLNLTVQKPFTPL